MTEAITFRLFISRKNLDIENKMISFWLFMLRPSSVNIIKKSSR